MDHDAESVKPLPDFKLHVALFDGRQGVFDLKPHLQMVAMAALREVAYFNQAQILFGAVTWPGGEDIAPDTLAAELQALASV